MQQDDKDKQKPERLTVAQDGYPSHWGHGQFGHQFRRPWFSKPGDAFPVLKKDNGK